MTAASSIEQPVSVRLPFNAKALLAYLRIRAMPGVEEVDDGTYRRTFAWHGQVGVLSLNLSHAHDDGVLVVGCDIAAASDWARSHAKALVDATADVTPIELHLARDRRLRRIVLVQRGLRIPGTTDPFELAVRAILGQQISVAGARALAARVAARFGRPLARPTTTLKTSFPTPQALRMGAIEELGVPRSRARAIRRISELVVTGDLALRRGVSPQAVVHQLLEVPGVGPWTASYIALRALGDGDALAVGDLGLRQVLGTKERPMTQKEMARAAEPWRPWRGYAAVHLWTTLLPETR